MNFVVGIGVVVVFQGINANANDVVSCGQNGISRLEFLSSEQTRAFNASLQLGPPKPIEAMSLCDPSKVALPMTSAIAETFFCPYR